MKYFRLISGLFLMIVSFYFFLLALMNLVPIILAGPLLFLSIVWTLSPLAAYKRFKGFRP
ncbi:hypothetical protein [Halalkalibacter oceani]|uniref:Uncharacterized protein n=1 Tax=Halalkalibacter oceani TaxID=1653776 RepID=A0A9X2DSC7_9BACI|nr:hypothetical protein [Halalkalibacter oceani]MCM3715593.1 hypothetical protein [Halalkalibacter oceani]